MSELVWTWPSPAYSLAVVLLKNQQHDFGIGAGLHNLDLSVFIEGDIVIDDESTEFFRGEADKSQPLPNLGAWYHVSSRQEMVDPHPGGLDKRRYW